MQTNINAPALCAHFTGQYLLTGTAGNYFQNSSGLLLKVCERKSPSPLKPLFYLMHRDEAGRFTFLTSLYPDGSGTFTAEISRQYFTVRMDTSALTVWRK